jgi:two-component system response regulator MtrA
VGSEMCIRDRVNVHVQRLRSKIEHDAEHPEIVVTVRGVGYKAGVMGGS